MNLISENFNLNSDINIFLFIIIIFLCSLFTSIVLKFLIVLYLKKTKKELYSKTSIQFLKNSVNFLVLIFAVCIIIFTIPVFRSKAMLIFSGAGILAALIGFAAQAAISNLIAGAFIVLFKPFRVGDFIKLDGERIGIVEDINLRHTIINNFENKRLIIPNSIISTESVLNHTIEDHHILGFIVFRIGVYADIDLARKIIIEETLKLDGVIDLRTPEEVVNNDPQIIVKVISVDNDAIQLRAYIWVLDPIEEYNVRYQLNENVHKRFIQEGIELPKAMNTIYIAK